MTPIFDGGPTMDSISQAAERFTARILAEHRDDLGGIDGGWLQDTFVECGLLEYVDVTGPCGESCECSGYGDFPQRCLRPTEVGLAILDRDGRSYRVDGE